MSDIDISEPLSDLLAPLNNEQREFLMNNYTIQTYKKERNHLLRRGNSLSFDVPHYRQSQNFQRWCRR